MTIGDIVQLKSGGPKMTVQRIIGSDRTNFGIIASDEYLKLRGFYRWRCYMPMVRRKFLKGWNF